VFESNSDDSDVSETRKKTDAESHTANGQVAEQAEGKAARLDIC